MLDEVKGHDDFKAFHAFVDKCVFDFHTDHPNVEVSRKIFEQKCFSFWRYLDRVTKRAFVEVANHFENIRTLVIDFEENSMQETRTPTAQQNQNSDDEIVVEKVIMTASRKRNKNSMLLNLDEKSDSILSNILNVLNKPASSKLIRASSSQGSLTEILKTSLQDQPSCSHSVDSPPAKMMRLDSMSNTEDLLKDSRDCLQKFASLIDQKDPIMSLLQSDSMRVTPKETATSTRNAITTAPRLIRTVQPHEFGSRKVRAAPLKFSQTVARFPIIVGPPRPFRVGPHMLIRAALPQLVRVVPRKNEELSTRLNSKDGKSDIIEID